MRLNLSEEWLKWAAETEDEQSVGAMNPEFIVQREAKMTFDQFADFVNGFSGERP